MIRLIEAYNYRCLRYVRQELGEFHVLVGPNASGKSTFLDAPHFIGNLLSEGLSAALESRSPNFVDLLWMGKGKHLKFAVELAIPEDGRLLLPKNGSRIARYEVGVGFDGKRELAILDENLWLKAADDAKPAQRELFPNPAAPPDYMTSPAKMHAGKGWKAVVTKKADSGNDYFSAETTRWRNPFRLGPRKLALANLPEDEERFPVAVWVKRVLMEGIHRLVLSSEAMRKPSPPGSPTAFQPDGSNLPLVIEDLKKREDEFGQWIAHVRTALPDLVDIEVTEREEDKHRYLRLVYRNGLKSPSWTVSDGTLRLLALTLLAYAGKPGAIYLIEEPENGIHPRAVETVFQSLSSSYGSQVLCASHSPVMLNLAKPEQILCFAKDREGATDIVTGSNHPNLRDWKKGVNLGTLFSSGVLG